MSRFDRARWDAATFPYSISVPVRFDDLDTLGHVNNVAVAAILQEGRVGFHRYADRARHAKALRMMAVRLEIEYAGEMHHGDPLEVKTGVLAIGRTSFTVAQIGQQKGRTTVYASTTLVYADANGPAPIPAPLRAEMEAMRLDIE